MIYTVHKYYYITWVLFTSLVWNEGLFSGFIQPWSPAVTTAGIMGNPGPKLPKCGFRKQGVYMQGRVRNPVALLKLGRGSEHVMMKNISTETLQSILTVMKGVGSWTLTIFCVIWISTHVTNFPQAYLKCKNNCSFTYLCIGFKN